MRALLTWLVLLLVFPVFAQDDEVRKTDNKARGLVKQMHVLGYMVRMVGDSLVYGEKWVDITYLFNEDRAIVKSYYIPENNTLDTMYTIYTYDSVANLALETTVRGKGKYNINIAHKYIENQLAEDGIIESSGKYYPDYKYVYHKDSVEKIYTADTAGRRFAKYMNRFKVKYVYFFDADKKVIKRDYYTSNKLYESVSYEYDPFNNVQTSKHYKENKLDDVYTYEYLYDDHHNFIKRTEYKNSRIYNITTRDIIYQ